MADTQIGNYRLGAQLGTGSAGDVYVAEDVQFGGRVIIKVLHPVLGKAEGGLAGIYLQGLRGADALLLPGIAKLFESGHTEAGSNYLACEYLGQKSLAAHLVTQGGRLPEPQAYACARDLAATLTAAHARGLVHGDLHPGNVFLVPDPKDPGAERARLTDFGLAACAAEWHRTGGPILNRPGSLHQEYLAPEQRRDPAQLSERADVYALAVLLHRMLTGEAPAFEAAVPRPHPSLGQTLQRLLIRMLDLQPAGRPPMSEVEAALEGLVPRRLGEFWVLSRIEDDGAWSLSEVVHRDGGLRGLLHARRLDDVDGDEDARAASRFLEPARLLQKLHVHGMPKVLEVGERPGQVAFVVVAPPEGETLAERLRRRGPLGQQGVSLCRQVAATLAAAHAQGLLHLSLSLSRIEVTDDLTEEGLDDLDQDVSERAALRYSRALRIAGKPPSGGARRIADLDREELLYMSPEQIRGDLDIDGKADVYALGAVLYEVLSGQPPHTAETQSALAEAHLTREPRPLAEVEPAVPADLSLLCGRMLAKDRATRPAMAEVAIELQQTFASEILLRLRRGQGTSGAAALLAALPNAHLLSTEVTVLALLGVLQRRLIDQTPGTPAFAETAAELGQVAAAVLAAHRDPILSAEQLRLLASLRNLLDLLTPGGREHLTPALLPALRHPIFPRGQAPGAFPQELIAAAARLAAKAPPAPTPALPWSPASFAQLYRYAGPALPQLPNFTRWVSDQQQHVWSVAREGHNPCEVQVIADANERTNVLQLTLQSAGRHKAMVVGQVPADLSAAAAVVIDVHSTLWHECYLSLLFKTREGKAYETRPLTVGTGWTRNLRFPLDLSDFKSDASPTPWGAYDTRFSPRGAVEQIALVLYNHGDSGVLRLGPLRVQKA